MEDHLDALHHAIAGACVADVALDELDAGRDRGDVTAMPGGQVVEDSHLVAVGGELVGEM